MYRLCLYKSCNKKDITPSANLGEGPRIRPFAQPTAKTLQNAKNSTKIYTKSANRGNMRHAATKWANYRATRSETGTTAYAHAVSPRCAGALCTFSLKNLQNTFKLTPKYPPAAMTPRHAAYPRCTATLFLFFLKYL